MIPGGWPSWRADYSSGTVAATETPFGAPLTLYVFTSVSVTHPKMATHTPRPGLPYLARPLLSYLEEGPYGANLRYGSIKPRQLALTPTVFPVKLPGALVFAVISFHPIHQASDRFLKPLRSRP